MYFPDMPFFRVSPLGWRHVKPVAVWISGFLFGCLIAGAAEPPISSLMLRALDTPMSIDGLLTAYFLPFLLAAAAAYFKRDVLLLVLCFWKAFSFAFLACCLMVSVNAAWLLLPLLLFSDMYIGILLLWMFVFTFERPFKLKFAIGVPAVLTALAACLDYFCLTPFLAAIVV